MAAVCDCEKPSCPSVLGWLGSSASEDYSALETRVALSVEGKKELEVSGVIKLVVPPQLGFICCRVGQSWDRNDSPSQHHAPGTAVVKGESPVLVTCSNRSPCFLLVERQAFGVQIQRAYDEYGKERRDSNVFCDAPQRRPRMIEILNRFHRGEAERALVYLVGLCNDTSN